tara:strand:- start:4965 stop:5357 length:393 start_codon:yes stop_codon:yes gene_type:complete
MDISNHYRSKAGWVSPGAYPESTWWDPFFTQPDFNASFNPGGRWWLWLFVEAVQERNRLGGWKALFLREDKAPSPAWSGRSSGLCGGRCCELWSGFGVLVSDKADFRGFLARADELGNIGAGQDGCIVTG